MLENLKSRLGRLRPSLLLDGLTALAAGAIIVQTSLEAGGAAHRALDVLIVLVWALLTADFFVKLARTRGSSANFLLSAEGLIGFIAVIALPLGWVLTQGGRDTELFGLFWVLRYMRDSADLTLFWRVIERSRLALLSIASVFVVIFLAAATLAYLFERHIQPDGFGSVPQAMWWAIVTLTTTGYGDVVPETLWGRLLAGWVMVGGTVMFALQAGIIATAFAEELRRRHFLQTWDLVVGVPFFQSLGAAAIADIVRLVRHIDVAPGAQIVRAGDPGDAMYFIVSGEAAVQLPPEPVILKPGGFIGEMALIFGTPRSADVIATKPSMLLVLDVADFRDLAGRRPEIVSAIETEGKRRREENAALHRGFGIQAE